MDNNTMEADGLFRLMDPEAVPEQRMGYGPLRYFFFYESELVSVCKRAVKEGSAKTFLDSMSEKVILKLLEVDKKTIRGPGEFSVKEEAVYFVPFGLDRGVPCFLSVRGKTPSDMMFILHNIAGMASRHLKGVLEGINTEFETGAFEANFESGYTYSTMANNLDTISHLLHKVADVIVNQAPNPFLPVLEMFNRVPKLSAALSAVTAVENTAAQAVTPEQEETQVRRNELMRKIADYSTDELMMSGLFFKDNTVRNKILGLSGVQWSRAEGIRMAYNESLNAEIEYSTYLEKKAKKLEENLERVTRLFAAQTQELEELQNELQRVNQPNAEHTQEIARLGDTASQHASQEAEQLRERVQQLTEELKKCNEELNVISEDPFKLPKVTETFRNHTREFTQLYNKIRALENEKSAMMQSNNQTKEAMLEEHKTQIEAMQNQINALKAENERSRGGRKRESGSQEIDALKREHEKELAELNHTVQWKQKRVDDQQAYIKNLKEESNDLLKKARAERDEFKSQLEKLQNDYDSLEMKFNDSDEDVEVHSNVATIHEQRRILEELENQKRQLVEEKEKLEQEVRQIINNKNSVIQELEAKNNELQNELQRGSAQLEHMRQENVGIRKEMADLQALNQRGNEQLNQAMFRGSEIQKELDSKLVELSDAKMRLENANHEKEDLMKQLRKLNEQISEGKAQEAKIAQLEGIIERGRVELADTGNVIIELRKELANKEQTIVAYTIELFNEGEKIEKLTTEITELKRQAELFTAEKQLAVDEAKKAVKAEADTFVDQLNAQIAQMQQEKNDLLQQLQSLTQDNEKCKVSNQQQRELKDQEIANLNTRIETISAELASMNAQLSAKDQALQEAGLKIQEIEQERKEWEAVVAAKDVELGERKEEISELKRKKKEEIEDLEKRNEELRQKALKRSGEKTEAVTAVVKPSAPRTYLPKLMRPPRT